VYDIAETQPTIPGSNPAALYLDGREQNGTPAAGSVDNDIFHSIDLSQAPFFGDGYNFGELRPASVSGYVFVDGNGNGVRDASDQGIAGVTILLQGTDDLGRAVSSSVVTDATGAYSFQRLRPGTYTVTEVQPTTFADGADHAGTGLTASGTAGNDV